MSERTTGEASESTGRAGFVQGLAVLAATLSVAWLNLPALLLPGLSGPARRPSIKPPSRSVKRRG
jgi:hypothetical protein